MRNVQLMLTTSVDTEDFFLSSSSFFSVDEDVYIYIKDVPK